MLFHGKTLSNTLINWTDKTESEKRNRHTIILGTKGIKMEDIHSSLSGNEITVLQNVLTYEYLAL